MSRRIVSDTLHVTLIESGDSIEVTGRDRDHVEFVLGQLVQFGSTIVQPPRESGSAWTASCRRVEIRNNEVQIEALGNRFFIRSRSEERVRAEVATLAQLDAPLEGEIFKIGDFYTAACHRSNAISSLKESA
jgi:hypothetical protein